MSRSSNKQNQQHQRQLQSLRPQGGSTSTDTIPLKKGIRNLLVILLVLQFANICFYNTGWMNWKDDTWDVGWAAFLLGFDLLMIYLLNDL